MTWKQPQRVARLGGLAALIWVWVSCPVFAQTVSITGRLVLENGSGGDADTDHTDAVVWLTPVGTPPSQVAASPSHFEIRQKDKRFSPRVLPMAVGSTVDFPNLDPFFHNVFSLFEGKRFDLGLYEAGTSRSARFDRPGVSYIFCNIHPDMVAIIVSVESDFFGLTDSHGSFLIEDVPAGTYQLHVWHERMQVKGDESAARSVLVGSDDIELPAVPMVTNDRVLEKHTNKFGLEYESTSESSPPYLLPR